MNNVAKMANALAISRPCWSDISGAETGGRTIAEPYADTYGSESLPEFAGLRITRTRLLAGEFNALKVGQASANGDSLAPTVMNAARLGLYDTSGDGTPVKTTFDDVASTAWALAIRFGSGVAHGPHAPGNQGNRADGLTK